MEEPGIEPAAKSGLRPRRRPSARASAVRAGRSPPRSRRCSYVSVVSVRPRISPPPSVGTERAAGGRPTGHCHLPKRHGTELDHHARVARNRVSDVRAPPIMMETYGVLHECAR